MTKPLAGQDLVVVVDAIQPCWLSDADGDPGRTCDPASAKRFASGPEARSALSEAQTRYPSRTYRIDTLPGLSA